MTKAWIITPPSSRHQRKGIDRARELNPDAGLSVERVRNTKAGSRDKWRKA